MLQARSWLPRSEGSLRLEFRRRDASSALQVLHQAGVLRARFPKPEAQECPEAVLVIGHGLTGGDKLDIGVTSARARRCSYLGCGGEDLLACDGEAVLRVNLDPGPCTSRLPQPTILFDAALRSPHRGRSRRRSPLARGRDVDLRPRRHG
jgi:urease accessory protein